MGKHEDLVDDLLRSRPDWFGPVLENVDYHEVQILYTQIDRDAENGRDSLSTRTASIPNGVLLSRQYGEAGRGSPRTGEAQPVGYRRSGP